MATIVLAAAGSALGAGFGGTVLGLSGAVIGRAVGATLGRVIDQRLLGAGSATVETGRVERFRLTGASEGAPVGLVYGRMRVAGQVIWASRFAEDVTRSGGGKGAPQPKTAEYSYTLSLAIALCEGPITRVGRIWADGTEVARDDLPMRVYRGTEDQLPDPKIAAVEGERGAPGYRGMAYVVFEDLPLGQFGNRVPQFTFEVLRPAPEQAGRAVDLTHGVRAVALIPGTGEYALATTPVHFSQGSGVNRSANINSPSGKTDLATSLEMLAEELPNCGSVSLVVSWFGDDLRCGACRVKPKVEQRESDGVGMPWRVSGVARAEAELVALAEGRPVYGGTPADASVIEAVAELRRTGQRAMFYPFMLMDQQAGNGKPDPYGARAEQAPLPWRGRITTAKAPGVAGTADRTAAAAAEVAAFFGSARASDFVAGATTVDYVGPEDWGYRRLILHYAHLTKLAGGVDAFCIGSELRGITQVRGAGDSFPAVAALRALLADVRAIVGPGVKLGYAADWTEYFGYQADGNRYFHLDPLWADPALDFVGIDNYMPLSDWRDGEDHADAAWGSIYDLGYLEANVAGGEGFDWYYASQAEADAQVRTPITDGAYDEPWVYRYKDVRSWWSKEHHERINGTRVAAKTAWVPQSKPVWFTELGCPATDKGTNEPNKFVDPKSSESSLPKYSNGQRDDLIQMQYLRAMFDYWSRPANNPASAVYGGAMVDMGRAHVWCWDARPYPFFPNAVETWSDGENYFRGHWIIGRTAAQPLAGVVADLCERAGVRDHDVSRLYGLVRGYGLASTDTARAALQPLVLVHGFDAIERDGTLVFRMRTGRPDGAVAAAALAQTGDGAAFEAARAPAAETAGRVRLSFVSAEGDYDVRAVEAIFPDEASIAVSQSEVAMVLTVPEGRGIAERWLAEARVARDTARFALPLSALRYGAGDTVTLEGRRYRIDRVEQGEARAIEAVRVEAGVYLRSDAADEPQAPRAFVAPVPLLPVFLDLPRIAETGDEAAPYLAVAGTPWPGTAAVWTSQSDDGYDLLKIVGAPATVGRTLTVLPRARGDLVDRGPAVRVRMAGGRLASASRTALLGGANLMAIGDGSSGGWELMQFERAELVERNVYELTSRLRGRFGTEGAMPDAWAPGSRVVLLNAAVERIDLPASARGMARHYRIGNARREYSDPSYVHLVEAFDGIGLRPYAVSHLRDERAGGGDRRVTWIRRTRVDGDGWQGLEVPLGEAVEAYRVRVERDGTLLRDVSVSAPEWLYTAAMRSADGAGAVVRVAQVSQAFGPGPYREITIDG